MYSQQNKILKKKSLKHASTVFLLMAAVSVLSMSVDDSYAVWDEGAQGIKVTGTDGDFDTASVQTDFFGVDFGGTSASYGVGVQANTYVDNQSIGTNYLWVQSVVEARPIPTTTYSTYTCQTQSGTDTCAYPNEIKVKSTFQMFTDHNIWPFTCPSGWTEETTYCWDELSFSSETTKDIGDIGDKRFDLYAYQELQSDGEIYAEMKFRTCDDDDGPCTDYTSLDSHTSNQVANTNEEYTSDSVEGTTYDSNGVTVGYEGNSIFRPHDDTYFEMTYNINDGSANHSYKTGNNSPGEANDDVCWWESISDSGGSSPNFKSSAKYDTSCDSS